MVTEIGQPDSSLPYAGTQTTLTFSVPGDLRGETTSFDANLDDSGQSFEFGLISTDLDASVPTTYGSSYIYFNEGQPYPEVTEILHDTAPPSLPFLPTLSDAYVTTLISSGLALTTFTTVPRYSGTALVTKDSTLPS